MRLACRAGTQPAVAAELVAHPRIRFLALVSGRYDLVAEVCTDRTEPLFQQLVGEFQGIAGVEWSETQLILREHKVAQDWSWQLLADNPGPPVLREPHLCGPGHLDDLDREIVAALTEDGRLPFSAVAVRVGLDETTVRRRFEVLASRGCVRTLTLVPSAALGFTSELLLELSAEPARLHDVAGRMATFPGVRFLADTLDGALLCELFQPDVTALHAFLTDTVSRLDGVRGWEASMELLTLKRGFIETPWWRDQLPAAGSPPDNGARSTGRRRSGSPTR